MTAGAMGIELSKGLKAACMKLNPCKREILLFEYSTSAGRGSLLLKMNGHTLWVAFDRS